LPPATEMERRVLDHIGALPNVRLACQLRPTANVAVAPLILAASKGSTFISRAEAPAGEERNLVVLFADLRGFTNLAERKLPYDLVFILNSYFKVAGDAVTSAGGVVEKFIGDGVMALFGMEDNVSEACRQALTAASALCVGLEAFNKSLAAELYNPLRIGIGIHQGPVVIGCMGYGEAVHVTAIGDTVDVASRLQGLTKKFACQAIISEDVAWRAEVAVTNLPHHAVKVRNRIEALNIYVVDNLPMWLSSLNAITPMASPTSNHGFHIDQRKSFYTN